MSVKRTHLQLTGPESTAFCARLTAIAQNATESAVQVNKRFRLIDRKIALQFLQMEMHRLAQLFQDWPEETEKIE
jgi:hypothetical protein